MKLNKIRYFIICLLVLLVVSFSDLGITAHATESSEYTIKTVSLGVGRNETERNITWHADSAEAGMVQYAEKTGEDFPSEYYEAVAMCIGATNDSGFYVNQATITGLKPDTEYVYRLVNGNTVSAIYSFETSSKDAFSFLFVGDPQIGSSGTSADADRWANTLNVAVENFPDSELLISAGDQVDNHSNESQYEAYLDPQVMQSLTNSTVIGNHDTGSTAYSEHFYNPNTVSSDNYIYGATAAGCDYWYVYNNVLFLNLNTNNLSTAEHKAFMENAVAMNPDVDWKIVVFHHSLYSAASHFTQSDIVQRRNELVPVFTDLDIDVVLQGHDHVYVRTYMMNGLVPDTTNGVQSSVTDPTGILYITGNSSTGSKYYNILTNHPLEHAAVKSQEYSPSYSNVEVSKGSFKITTYRVTDGSILDSFEIIKTVEPATVAGQQLVLGDGLNMHFHTKVDPDFVDSAVMKVTVGGEEFSCSVADAPKDVNGNFIVSVDLAAAQMTDTITLQVEADGIIGTARQYSVRKYAEYILEGEYSEATKSLVREMLNYGAMAQLYFGYQSENLANTGYESTSNATIPAGIMSVQPQGEVEGISFYGASLVFRNKIAVRYYFNVTGNISDYRFQVGTQSYTPVLNNGLYYVEIPEINPQDYCTVINLTVSSDSASMSVGYSPMHYIVRKSTTTTDTNLRNLLKALYAYYDAATSYLDNVDVVKDGQSSFVILLPETASQQLVYAAQELQYFFKEATGVQLRITNQLDNANGAYFSIGQTAIFDRSGIALDEAVLGQDGYKVVTLNNSILMVGITDAASTYAVYGYLAEQFGLEIYSEDAYEIQTVTTASLPALDITKIPVIPAQDFVNVYVPNFRALHTYLSNKLMWNPDLDTDDLTQNFMRNYYGAGYESVYQFYTAWIAHLESLKNSDMYPDTDENQIWTWCDESLFSEELLTQWDGCFTAALAANEAIAETDPEVYALFRNRIRADRCLVRYLLLSIYSQSYDNNTYSAMIDEFLEITDIYGYKEADAIASPWCEKLTNEEPVITAEDFVGDNLCFDDLYIKDGNQIFPVVRVTASNGQISFNFTDNALAKIQAYAEKNGVAYITIYTSTNLNNNGIVIAGAESSEFGKWKANSINISELPSVADFRSSAVGPIDVYLRFAFNVISEDSFTGSQVKFAAYEDTIADVSFAGIKVTSGAYQPHFYFTSDAVADIQAYAEANNYNSLIIHHYAIITSGNSGERFALNGTNKKLNQWITTDVEISEISTNYDFWSQSSGLTEVYMWFEFGTMSIINADSFESIDPDNEPVSFANYTGLLNNSGFTGTNEEFTGVYVTSSATTPSFKFTAEAVEEIKAYAAENGYTHLKIYANAVLTESTPRFIMDKGGTYQTYVAAAKWYSNAEAMPIDYISEDIEFYSQFSNTRVYLKFEFIKETVENPYGQAIHAGSFESVDAAEPVSFADYKGLLNNSGFTGTNEEFTGVYVTSSAATPYFKFTAKAVEEIKAYAAENGYTHLKIYANAVLTESTPRFIMDHNGTYQTYVAAAKWYSHTEAMPIDYISENIKFYSQFYNTQVYLKFEFIKETVENPYGQAIHAGSFESVDAAEPVSFADYKGLLNNSGFTGTNEEFTGVYVTSSAATPYFKFTAKAVEEIKAYAAENGYTHLKIYANAVLTESTPRFIMDHNGTYQTYVAAAKWYSHTEAMPIDYISENIKFYSQFYNTQIYLRFEFLP